MRPTVALSLLLTTSLLAQTPAPAPAPAATPGTILPFDTMTTLDQLNSTVAALDAEVFHAYNHCAEPGELARFNSRFTDDVEFYHDQRNASTFGLPALSAAIEHNICGKLTRELIPGTLRVYPMSGTGAIEMGQHRFFHTGSTTPTGEADFVMLWVFRNNTWKISRVLSYNHHPTH